MIPWALIDRATVPGGGELRLMQRDAEFSIMLGTIQLMSSRRAGSEEALATIVRPDTGHERRSLFSGGHWR
jgi:hypothetical protein